MRRKPAASWFRRVSGRTSVHGPATARASSGGRGCHPVPVTRRFDIGPVLVALGALVLLVGLFLDWYGGLNAWDSFELADVLLAVLALAALAGAVGLLAADAEYLDRRALPWIAGGTFVLVAAELINPPPGAGGQPLGLGAWLAFAAAVVMVAGTVLTFGRVSLAVAV